MSFGFGVGDFCTVSILAWKCYKSCRESSDDFQALSTEVATLHAVIKEAEENILKRKVRSHQEPELLEIGKGCYDVLKDLDALLLKYESLATKTQKTWDRFRWSREDAEKLRSRMVSNVVLLTAFNTSVAASCQARVEKKLNKLLAEIRCGDRDGSVISTESIESINNDEKEAWDHLCHELEDLGISASLASTHKAFIVKWMKEAVEAGMLDECDGLGIATSNTFSAEEATLCSPGTETKSLKSGVSLKVEPITRIPLQTKLTIGSKAVMMLLRPFRSPVAIHKATRDNDLVKMRIILTRGCNINFKDDYNLTPLHWAIMRGHMEASRLLLDWGADSEARDSDGRTALGMAAWQGSENLTELLLEYNADIASADFQGFSPLHGTARNRCPKVCGILLLHGAPVDVIDSRGWTPFHWAARQGFDEMLDLLSGAGSDILAKGNEGETALALAVREGHETAASKIQELYAAQH